MTISRKKSKKSLETNENEFTTVQNLRDTAKAVLRRKLIATQAYLKRIETFQINNLTLHLEEQQQTWPRAGRRKEITKITAELNDLETKRTILRIKKSRSSFFEEINKIDKPLSRLIKGKEERTQINKIRNERGAISASWPSLCASISCCPLCRAREKCPATDVSVETQHQGWRWGEHDLSPAREH